MIKLITLLSLIYLALSQPSGSGGPGGSSSGSSGPGEDDDSSSTATETTCDPCGADASYEEELDTDTGVRTIRSTGCPNHYNYCTGKGGDCGELGEEGSITEAYIKDYVFEIPAY